MSFFDSVTTKVQPVTGQIASTHESSRELVVHSLRVISLPGAKRWIVSNFTLLDKSFSQKIDSPTFEMAGLPWSFRLYPMGHNAHGFVALFLTNMSDAPIKASYAFSIVNPQGQRMHTSKEDEAKTFDPRGDW